MIHYLHSVNLCHRDIKAENIMIDRSNRVRVIDFGMSKHISSAKTRGVGTADYLAPELLSECTAFETLTSKRANTQQWWAGLNFSSRLLRSRMRARARMCVCALCCKLRKWPVRRRQD